MKAKTESGGLGGEKSEAVRNLFMLLRIGGGSPDLVRKFEEDYQTGTIRYGDMKKALAEGMVAFIGPIREKAEAIRNDLPYLRRVMEQGADKARASAQETLKLVREAIGLNYYLKLGEPNGKYHVKERRSNISL